jgi:sugar lactone lactonase YvrE
MQRQLPALNGFRARPAALTRALPLLLGSMLLLVPAITAFMIPSAHAFSNGQSASLVVGQVNFGSVSQYRANGPGGMVFDSSGNLWVADTADNRVLRFPAPLSNGVAANLVLGQPDFVSSAAATTQTGMDEPVSLTFDSSGNLWVVDLSNSRVLKFSPPFSTGMGASLVIGQPAFTTNQGQGITTSSSLYNPYDARFDSSGNLWVSDCSNDRVLRYSLPFTTGMNANLVLGQSNFVTFSPGTSQTQFKCPVGLDFDSSGNLWVTDYFNNRVLRFGGTFTTGMNANLVIGQSSYTTNTAGSGANGLDGPWYVATDVSGNLWVDDQNNFRALGFSPQFSNGMSASLVIGAPSFSGSGTYQIWFNSPIGIITASCSGSRRP